MRAPTPLAAALLALAVAAAPPLAVAQPTGQTEANDLRCVIALGMFAAQAKGEDARVGAAAGLGYFIGRLKGRNPAIDLKARTLAEAGKLQSLEDLKPDFARCGAEVQAFGQETTDLGEALKAFGEQKQRSGG